MFAALALHQTPSYEPLYKLAQPNTIHPRTLTNMIKTLSSLTLPSPMLSVALTGSRCWLTAWMCLIINRAACATTEGLWWQNLRPQRLPLPFCLPKCHLNEIGPRSLGIRHCIITYLKTLIEHFIKRLALRFRQGGHYSKRDVFVCWCIHVLYACVCGLSVDLKMRVCIQYARVCILKKTQPNVTLNSRVALLAGRPLACFLFTLHFDTRLCK